MYTSIIFTLMSALVFEVSHGDEIPNEKIVDVKEFFDSLKFIPEMPSNIFSSTQVNADLRLYNIGLKNEDIHLNVSQLITKYGHRVEEHNVQTKDGYHLSLVRIPSQGPVVFLMHGLLMSADDWIIAGPESGIAYLLSHEGYDVWMGNARGNKHSRRHEVLSPSSPEFWDFSWDEIGRYDLPAMIDYVLNTTNQTKLSYVGHSQGTTSFIVMCSELPEYNDKISVMVALSAPTALPNLKSPFLNFLKFVTFFHPEMLFGLVKLMGFYEFLPDSHLTKTFGVNICGKADLAELVCGNVVFMVCGFNAAQLNVTNLPVLFSHTPAGAATKQIEHFSQSVMTGKFRRFDYGEAKNLKMYGAKEPPEYQVESITAPMALFYSDNDWLVSVEDVEVLRGRLKNVVDYYKVPLQGFNHIDYVYGIDLKELVFAKMLSLIKENDISGNST